MKNGYAPSIFHRPFEFTGWIFLEVKAETKVGSHQDVFMNIGLKSSIKNTRKLAKQLQKSKRRVTEGVMEENHSK